VGERKAAVAAMLAGARSFTAIGEWAADAPPRVLAALGVRYGPLAGCFRPPDEATIRRVMEAVDAAAAEAAVGSWLAARLRAGAAACRYHARDATRVLATVRLTPA
jgi:DDE_Tnp_1-associated